MLIPQQSRGRFCFFLLRRDVFVAGGLLYWRSRVLTARKKVDAELDEIFRVPDPIAAL